MGRSGSDLTLSRKDAVLRICETQSHELVSGLAGEVDARQQELQGGEIWAEASAGDGTTFVFKIPAAPRHAAIRETSE